MIAYYRIVELIEAHLKADRDINTVTIGNLDKVDLDKQSIYPLAHILVLSSNKANGTITFSLQISVMDVVDVNKSTDETNYQDVLNTQLAVLENLEVSLDKGTLQEFGLELLSPVSKDPFEDRFKNLMAGWSGTFDIAIPNEIQSCGNSYLLGDITFSNDIITFSNDNNS